MNRRNFLQLAGSGGMALGLSAYLPAFGRETFSQSEPWHFDYITDPHAVANWDGYNTVAGHFEELILPHIVSDNVGPGKFMMVSGDLDVFYLIKDVIKRKIIDPFAQNGKTYGFYPTLGNHDSTNTSTRDNEKKNGANLEIFWNWMKDNYTNLNWSVAAKSNDAGFGTGGEGLKYVTYSWDYDNCHFISLNLYADASGFPVVLDYQLDWLKSDLEATNKEHIFIQGHQPVFGGGAINDACYVYNHNAVSPTGDFWPLLQKYPVRAYFHGHTHVYGVTNQGGILHFNGGVSREESSSPRNCYTRIFVDGGNVTWKTHFIQNRNEIRVEEGTLASGPVASLNNWKRKTQINSGGLKIVRRNGIVQIKVSQPGFHVVEIIDAGGVVRWSGRKNDTYIHTFPISNFSNGMYIVRVSTDVGVLSDVLNIVK